VSGRFGGRARRRFGDEQIEALLRIRWWEWSDEQIKAVVPQLCSDSIDEFVQRHDPGPA
jgi:hypothetical protein